MVPQSQNEVSHVVANINIILRQKRRSTFDIWNLYDVVDTKTATINWNSDPPAFQFTLIPRLWTPRTRQAPVHLSVLGFLQISSGTTSADRLEVDCQTLQHKDPQQSPGVVLFGSPATGPCALLFFEAIDFHTSPTCLIPMKSASIIAPRGSDVVWICHAACPPW